MVQTDNGAEFQTAFHWHVLDKVIAHTYIKPRIPRLNDKVERSHCIDAEVFNDKLREWEDYYNHYRPHGGLSGQTPYLRPGLSRHELVAEEQDLCVPVAVADGQQAQQGERVCPSQVA
nr:integrase core domain-containing protein [Streptomyces botrytidirepellens]